MSTIGAVALGGLILLIFAFPLLIFPILTFIDCIRNTTLTKQSKIAWCCLIFFTWTLGASIYSFAATKRPLFRVMAVIVLALTAVALYINARKPKIDKAQSQARNNLKVQQQASYTAEWERYKPIYDAVGMSEVWAMMKAGKCDQAEQMLQNPASYEKMEKAFGSANRTKTLANGLKMCRAQLEIK